MSSPPEGKLETKAGHPPAVKAGGMRIVQKHPHTGDGKEEKDKDEQEWESARVTKTFPQRLHKWPTRSRMPPWTNMFLQEHSISSNLASDLRPGPGALCSRSTQAHPLRGSPDQRNLRFPRKA
ncbi:hypothetical protein ACRRTK_019944 [Alexandromys fortis]